MVRKITEIATEDQLMSYASDEYHKQAVYKKIWNILGFLIPTVGSCLYLFTIGIFRKRHRELIYSIWTLVHPQLFAKKYVPQVEITSLVPNEVLLRLYEQAKITANIKFEELFVLVELLQIRQPTACFEIGTFDGRTTLNMAANTPEGAVIYTLDLPREQVENTKFSLDPYERFAVMKETSGARYRDTKWERKIQQLYGDSATFDYTPYQGEIDFVFIDGSHTYEYVLSDSRNAIALLRNGKGTILWHDYPDTSSVLQAINFLQTSEPRFAGIRHIVGTRFAYLTCE
jgi:predicted O-methyltransferase YrrM